jgi:hypothetical protein
MKKICIQDLSYGVDKVLFRWDEKRPLDQHLNSYVSC